MIKKNKNKKSSKNIINPANENITSLKLYSIEMNRGIRSINSNQKTISKISNQI